jgi:ABC-2 type transport system ATP-binding protein
VDGLIDEYRFGDRQAQLAGTLSGGQKQRLALAGAVIHRPELLFLDEPTSAVDPESRRDFWDKLFELVDAGTTILVSTHLMDEAERCHRLAILDHGRLVADGTPEELAARLEGRTVVVHSDEPRRAHQSLLKVPGVLSVAQVGNALRVLSEPGAGNVEGLRDELRRAGVDASVEAAAPNLEDVFVAATQHDGDGDGDRNRDRGMERA